MAFFKSEQKQGCDRNRVSRSTKAEREKEFIAGCKGNSINVFKKAPAIYQVDLNGGVHLAVYPTTLKAILVTGIKGDEKNVAVFKSINEMLLKITALVKEFN